MSLPARHPLEDFVKHVGILTPQTIDRAPDSVGLYAWYGQLSFGPKDWEQQMSAGVDEGEKTCRSLIQRHTTRYTSPQVKLEGRGTFSTTWRGSLEDATTEQLRAIISGEVASSEPRWHTHQDDQKRFDKFQYVLARSDLRGTLLNALKFCTPFISSPIYIGVATNLRDRLKQHTDQLFKLAELVAKKPENRKKLYESDKSTFASRALAMGFNEDTVVVWTINLGSLFQEIERDDLRAIAESAEWLLNRWHKPLLGKR
ncbi:hypothetical protein [Corallococcus sp. M7]